MPNVLINRYLFRETFVPTLLCLLIFTVVLLAGRFVQLADLVISKGVALADILLLLAELVPPILSIILPLAFLMGIMLGFGRLCADSETVAMKANGIGLLHMARPVAALAAGCALLTMVLSFWGAPWGKRAFRATLFDMTSKQASIGLQSQVFLKQFSNLVLYANSIDERSGEMAGVFIAQQRQDEESPLLIFAESGRLQSDPVQQQITLRLQNGTIHRQGGGQSEGYQVIVFNNYELTPDLSRALKAENKGRRNRNEMTMKELWAAADGNEGPARAARAELHSRLCAPLAPLLFTLFALPFSTFSQRSGQGGGFVMGLMIYLTYYLATSLAETLTAKADATPVLTFWAVHLLLFGLGSYLLRQSALERPGTAVIWFDRCATRIKRFRDRHAHP